MFKKVLTMVLSAGLLLGMMPVSFAAGETAAYDLTVLPEQYQTITGWGVYPNSVGDGWIGKSAAHKAIYQDMGISMFRIELRGNCGDGDGNLVPEYIDTFIENLRIGINSGVSEYLISIWTPPAGMKTNNKIEGQNEDGTRATLLPEKEQTFCDYLVTALDYIQSKNLPAPKALSLQNEPNNAFDYYQCCYYDMEQYKRVAKLLRKTLDENGYENVMMAGPEGAQYADNKMWYGDAFSELENDAEFADAMDILASHSYYNPTTLRKQDIDDYAAAVAKFPEKEKWQTEYSTAHNQTAALEIDRAIHAMRVFTTDIAWVGNNAWFWWMGWDPRYSTQEEHQEAIIEGDGITSVRKSYIYQCLAQVYNSVPIGSKVMRLSTNDESVVNESQPQSDMVAFSNGNQMTILFINTSAEDKRYNLHGLSGVSANIYSITGSSDGMQLASTHNMTSDSIEGVLMPARSVNVIVTSNEDNSPPNVTYLKDNSIGTGADGVYISRSQSFDFVGKVDEAATVEFGGTPVTVDENYQFTKNIYLMGGDNVVRVDAKDVRGNKAEPQFFTFRYDPEYVGIEMDSLHEDVSESSYTIAGRVNVPSVVTINGQTVTTDENQQFSLPVTLTEGENTFTLTAADEQGNVSEPLTLTVNCDSQPPVITVLNDSAQTDDIEYVLHVQSGEVLKSLSINGRALTLGEDLTVRSKFNLQEGENILRIVAEDLAGNVTTQDYVVTQVQTEDTPHPTDAVSYSKKTDAPVTVDGALDEEAWVMDNKANKVVNGENVNNIVNFGTMWDDNNLYVGFEVEDHALIFDDDRCYQNDCVEVFLNPSGNRAGAYEEFDKQLFVGYIKDRVAMGENTGADYRYAWQDTPTGYTAEISIPWSSMGLSPAEGVRLGFDIACDDKDVSGPREAVIGWAGDSDNWQTTANFGLLVLTEGAVTYEDKAWTATSPGGETAEEPEPDDGQAPDGITVLFNGEPLVYDVQPMLVNDRTMVPIRVTAEALGADVEWDGDNQTVILTSGETVVTLTVDSATAMVGGQAVTLEAPAMNVDDRVLVPLRFINEAFGADVDWDGDTMTVTIVTG